MPIRILPPQLANQIAAGEVVERPASVVKELVENSLDAGATRIDIDIDRGGAKLIRIRDNGCGIGKDELALALARHATSKISSLDDLEAILSLGFRGEALASISSVSRLMLTSRTATQDEAWQAYAEGRDMAVTVKPAAHPQGSTVEVLDLFYNTPARRKFMRTEKTEFTHIDEVVRRIALARFDVAINLSHNGKLMRQYRAVKDPAQNSRRLASICSTTFVEHALEVEWRHGDLAIRGWVADPAGSRSLTDMQYCYVNNRMMKDRLINHAIRQAYQDQLKDDQQPAYVLYLDVDPHQVDVNVHPAKHEVRFHQSRLVHDFIYQAIVTVLQQAGSPQLNSEETAEEQPRWQPENRQAAGGNHFAQPSEPARSTPTQQELAVKTPAAAKPIFPETSRSAHLREPAQRFTEGNPYTRPQGDLYQRLLQPSENETYNTEKQSVPNKASVAPAVSEKTSVVTTPAQEVALEGHSQSFGRVMTVCHSLFALLEREQKLVLLSLPVAERWLKTAQLTPTTEGLRPQPLLIPVKLTLSKEERTAFTQHQAMLQHFGIEMLLEQQRGTLRAVPLPLRKQNLQKLIPDLLGYIAVLREVTPDAVAMWFARSIGSEHEVWTVSQAIQLLTDVERLCPQLVKSPPSGLLQPVDLQPALAAFKHD
ncbi:DNA mismatch repair protein MutL [Rouxiella silvae]|uniref:DNA mismatch repair protein MutL n=1 Tax=Rouxiella silvae TaxID=1646373 RepID=A0AA40X1E5_9GAMM|nr:DNA mismatch repair endonuclease MutL [Rouxiella silvae]KQN43609.1 DNA mismatch repair protein MutL [Serratia sp. Leaf50]MBF6636347.1 DNA mismatch repair endonuclease MutL [Rouxiella silvae]ORJ19577.1 DNA mismatch repair protein MutL [Rouxiella silvae]